MASGDVVGIITNIMPPGTNPATPAIRQAATSTENFPVWNFTTGGSDEMLDYFGVLEGYDGGGLTVEVKWGAATATSGAAVWQIGFRRLADDAAGSDMDAAHTYDYNSSGAVTAPSAAGEFGYDNVTFSDGADMDSLADGEAFVCRIRRDQDDTSATDNMTGNAQLVSIVITET